MIIGLSLAWLLFPSYNNIDFLALPLIVSILRVYKIVTFCIRADFNNIMLIFELKHIFVIIPRRLYLKSKNFCKIHFIYSNIYIYIYKLGNDTILPKVYPIFQEPIQVK